MTPRIFIIFTFSGYFFLSFRSVGADNDAANSLVNARTRRRISARFLSNLKTLPFVYESCAMNDYLLLLPERCSKFYTHLIMNIRSKIKSRNVINTYIVFVFILKKNLENWIVSNKFRVCVFLSVIYYQVRKCPAHLESVRLTATLVKSCSLLYYFQFTYEYARLQERLNY